jgi:Cytochrome bd terminal oxidase subunit I
MGVNQHYLFEARQMQALFAVGVVTGTILSFELGLLWPAWMADFGNVFGLGFTLEGFSFFLEAIFIGIYAYGWDRLRPGVHFLTGIPVAVAGVAVIVVAILRRLARVPLPPQVAGLARHPGVTTPGERDGLCARGVHPGRTGGLCGAGRG